MTTLSEQVDPRQRIIDWREATPDELPDDAIDAIELALEPVLIALCDQLGCVLVPDHCDKREHDYCKFCGRGRRSERITPPPPRSTASP